jgi:predicted nucleic acid-binding protein
MESRIQRIYLDTSVIGGYYDSEFEEDTRILFEKVKLGQFHVVLSDITEGEVQEAPELVRNLFVELSDGSAAKIELTEEAIQLAETYLAEKVVGKTSRVDCLHIALASINRVDILVSWNFKHIVNVQRIRGYNSVNMKLGYPTLDIRSPKEIIYYEY